MTIDELRAELQTAIRSDKRAAAILRKIAAGKASFTDTMNYSLISGRLTGRQLSEIILELTEGREELAEALLHDRYEDINAQCAAVQTSLDEKNGLHLAPQKAPFPADRVAKFVHSLVDPTVKDETIERRARSASENITVTFHDDFIAENAEFRDRAGIECFVERQTDGKCCPWCNKVAGRYRMQDQPEGLFSRHDNCGCTIIYDGQVLRGQIGENGRRGRRWVEQPPKVEYQKPTVLSRSEAERLQAEKLPKRLTGGKDSGIINYRDSSISDHTITEQIISNMPKSEVFSGEIGERYNSECKNLLKYAMNSGKQAGTEFSIILDESMKRIEGHSYITGENGHTKIENANVLYHAFHNHGSNGMLSFSDIFNFAGRSNQISISAIGNLGSSYILYTDSRNQSEIEENKGKYFFYLLGQATKPIISTSTGEKITFRRIMKNADGVKSIIKDLPEEERHRILETVISKTREHIREGEKYGFKYYEQRA